MSSDAAISPNIPATVYQRLGAFRRATSKYDHVSAARIKASGLTVQQYALMVFIAARGASVPSIGEAAQELMLSHNGTVELSQRAEKAGLLIRRSDPHLARRTLLLLSREGTERLEAATRRLVGELDQERLELQHALIRWRTLLASESFSGALRGEQDTTPAAPAFTVSRAGTEERSLIWNLLQLHLHGLSVYQQIDVGSDGQYPYPDFEGYWRDETSQAYMIQVEDRPAGFVLLRRSAPSTTELRELCVLPRFQGRGVGRGVMGRLFRLFPGRWCVAYHHQNLSVQHFWNQLLHGLGVESDREADVARPLGTGRQIEFSVSAPT